MHVRSAARAGGRTSRSCACSCSLSFVACCTPQEAMPGALSSREPRDPQQQAPAESDQKTERERHVQVPLGTLGRAPRQCQYRTILLLPKSATPIQCVAAKSRTEEGRTGCSWYGRPRMAAALIAPCLARSSGRRRRRPTCAPRHRRVR